MQHNKRLCTVLIASFKRRYGMLYFWLARIGNHLLRYMMAVR